MPAIAAAFCQNSAISSPGSPTISTSPTLLPLMTTGTFRISTGGATSSVNQRGAEARAAMSVGGIARIGRPVSFFTAIRTWRIERNCTGKFAKNRSAGSC